MAKGPSSGPKSHSQDKKKRPRVERCKSKVVLITKGVGRANKLIYQLKKGRF